MMSKVDFSVTISPENKDVALKAMALIAAMAEVSMREMANCVEGIEVVDAEEVKSPKLEKVEDNTKAEAQERIAEKPKRRRKKKAAKAEEKEEEKSDEGVAKDTSDSKVEKKAKEETEKAGDNDSEISIEDVRGLVKKVVADHRDEIKAKLKKLGATSVSTLPEDKYKEMYDYLMTLSK